MSSTGRAVTVMLLFALVIGTSLREAASGGPEFHGSSRPLNPQERRWMTGETWHKGCPLPIRKLRLLHVSYYNFADDVVDGRLVVHRRVAREILGVFRKLFEAEFHMVQVDASDLYPPAERPKHPGNVTASFNCREITSGGSWSQHSYGLAVDVNPVQNPYINNGDVLPKAGKKYVDRSQDLRGMIHRGDAVVRAFAGIGWKWGGKWDSLKDYMHFSENGR